MPSWTPMCKAMQVHCEPFFMALERWRQSGDGDLLRNRLALCETAFEIMNDYYQVQQKIEFDLICENNDIPLEPEKIPTAGKEYTFGGDRLAYNAARSIVPEHIFNRVGLFFQTNLLRGMAGFGDSVLAMCNTYNRHSILAAIEKLFRIANDAGKAHFAKRILFEGETTSSSKFKTHPTVPLSANGVAFATFIMDSLTRGKDRQAHEAGKNVEEAKPSNIAGKKRKEPPSSSAPRSDKRNTTSKKTRNNYTKANYPKEEEGDDDDESEPEWTSSHKSVGIEVANYFDLPEGRQLFRGAVVLYAPPSKRGANDQLYHIRWEDSDEEDYDEAQLQTAISLFEEQFSSRTNKPKPSTTTPTRSTRTISSPSSSSPTSASKTRATRQSAAASSSSMSSSLRKQTKRVVDLVNTDEEQQQQPEENSPDWTTHHPSIGTKVAAVFVVNRKSWLYHGTVTRYCPPSSPEADDQLYHIVWEDDDEQDYDEDELQQGVEKYAQAFGHNNNNNINSSNNNNNTSSSGKKQQPTKKHSRHSSSSSGDTRHQQQQQHQSNPTASSIISAREPSDKQAQSEVVAVDYASSDWSASVGDYPQIIGRRVAVYFPPSGRHKTLFAGVVTQYAKETSSVLHTRDQLYHVVFDDGDVCDLDEDGFQQGVALYNLHLAPSDTRLPEEHSLVHDNDNEDDNEHVQQQQQQQQQESEQEESATAGVSVPPLEKEQEQEENEGEKEGENMVVDEAVVDEVEKKVETEETTTSSTVAATVTVTAVVSATTEAMQVDDTPTDADDKRLGEASPAVGVQQSGDEEGHYNNNDNNNNNDDDVDANMKEEGVVFRDTAEADTTAVCLSGAVVVTDDDEGNDTGKEKLEGVPCVAAEEDVAP